MATASLNKFTVPLGTGIAPQGLLMPKLKYRFKVVFSSFGFNSDSTELTKQVVDFKRPDVSFDEQTIEIYNSKLKYAGKPSWGNTTVNLRDDATGKIAQLVGQQIQKQFDFAEQASARSGIDYKFTMKCEILDGGNGAYAPQILETWEMYGCYLQSADYGDLNYGDSSPVQIALTIAFDNALQTPLENSGIGISVPTELRTDRSNVTG